MIAERKSAEIRTLKLCGVSNPNEQRTMNTNGHPNGQDDTTSARIQTFRFPGSTIGTVCQTGTQLGDRHAGVTVELHFRDKHDNRPQSKWIKCPSVTTGGKPHFWHRRFSDGRRVNVAWDRSAKCWRMYYGANYELASGEMFDLARDAMRFADKFAANYKLQPYETR